MKKPFVALLMGSDSDLPTIRSTIEILDELGIPYEARIASAHRTPDETRAYVMDAERRGCAVFIAAAGLAAHLAGAAAAQTIRPVIGIPLEGGALRGIDALLSTVQMPGGIPVACVAIGMAGAKNAAWLAAQILALSNGELAVRLKKARENHAHRVKDMNDSLRERLKQD